jgi:RNA polymerase sigma factor (sigma-70 family)
MINRLPRFFPGRHEFRLKQENKTDLRHLSCPCGLRMADGRCICLTFHITKMPENAISLNRSPGFANTRWSMILQAKGEASRDQMAALESLCRDYWYPLYYFARREGRSVHDAQDLVQGFFARLLERHYLDAVEAKKGKFRSFLLAAFTNFMSDARRAACTQKRGGDAVHLSIDELDAENRYALEPADHRSPDRAFEKRWAETILARSFAKLREEFDGSGKQQRFDALKPHLLRDLEKSYEQTANTLGMSVAAVRSAIHRLRERFQVIFRAEIAHTVDNPADVDGEIRHLFTVMAE